MQEEERSCVFKPELSSRLESATSSAVPSTKHIRGVNKFIERQKIASEARKEKEMYQRRDIGANWIRKVTVPNEFNFASTANKEKKKEVKSNEESPVQKKSTGTPRTKAKDIVQEDQVDFDKARKDLHKNIRELQI